MVIELVFSVEMDGLRVMRRELVETVDHRIPRAEKAVHEVGLDDGKTVVGHGPVVFQ